MEYNTLSLQVKKTVSPLKEKEISQLPAMKLFSDISFGSSREMQSYKRQTAPWESE